MCVCLRLMEKRMDETQVSTASSFFSYSMWRRKNDAPIGRSIEVVRNGEKYQ